MIEPEIVSEKVFELIKASEISFIEKVHFFKKGVECMTLKNRRSGQEITIARQPKFEDFK